jgi:hypothetical protein
MKSIRKPDEIADDEKITLRPTLPDRKRTEPSFQFPADILDYHSSNRDIERVSVQVASGVHSHIPPSSSSTCYSVINPEINPEIKPEIDLKSLVMASHKFHKHLHKGLSNLTPHEKLEARTTLRELLKFLEI